MHARLTGAYAASVLVIFIYSGNLLVGKALDDLPPFTIAFFRLLIGFLVLLPLTYRSAWRHRATFAAHPRQLLVLTLTGVALFNTFIYSALQFTSATNAAVLETGIPAVTVALSAWLLHERLRPRQWAGVALSLVGSLWVVLNGQVFQLARMQWNVGDAIMVGAVLTWAVYSVAARQYLPLFPGRAVLLIMTGASVLLLLPVAMVEWWLVGFPPLDSATHWAGLAFLGIFPSVVALLLYNYAIGVLGPSRASIFMNLLPVVTMVGAFLLLGDRITWWQVSGAAIVIVGVLATTRRPRAAT